MTPTAVRFWGGPLDGEIRALTDPPYWYNCATLLPSWRTALTDATLLPIATIRYQLEPTANGGWRYVYVPTPPPQEAADARRPTDQ